MRIGALFSLAVLAPRTECKQQDSRETGLVSALQSDAGH